MKNTPLTHFITNLTNIWQTPPSSAFRSQRSLGQKGVWVISLGLLTYTKYVLSSEHPPVLQCPQKITLRFFCCWKSITSNVLKSHWRMVANFLITEFEFLGFFLCNSTLVLLSETKSFLFFHFNFLYGVVGSTVIWDMKVNYPL